VEGRAEAEVRALIDKHRDELPFSDQLPTFDPPTHTAHRAPAVPADHTQTP
jgi:hypothetical protein